jgi:hypothetical protein
MASLPDIAHDNWRLSFAHIIAVLPSLNTQISQHRERAIVSYFVGNIGGTFGLTVVTRVSLAPD